VGQSHGRAKKLRGVILAEKKGEEIKKKKIRQYFLAEKKGRGGNRPQTINGTRIGEGEKAVSAS